MFVSEDLPIGERIRLVREAKGLTQRELADLAGIERGSLASYETGRRGVQTQEIERLADAMGIEPTVFLNRTLWSDIREALRQAEAILTGAIDPENQPGASPDEPVSRPQSESADGNDKVKVFEHEPAYALARVG